MQGDNVLKVDSIACAIGNAVLVTYPGKWSGYTLSHSPRIFLHLL